MSGKPNDLKQATLDHVWPKSLLHTFPRQLKQTTYFKENRYKVCCLECNRLKGNMGLHAFLRKLRKIKKKPTQVSFFIYPTEPHLCDLMLIR